MKQTAVGEVDRELLKQFGWFQQLEGNEAQQAADDISGVSLKAGQVLVREGEPGDSMFVVLSGSIQISVTLAGGKEHPLSRLEPGAIFGETGLLLEQPRRATATAITEAELCCIRHADFEESLAAGEAWAGKFLMSMCRSLARRLSTMDESLVKMLDEGPAKPVAEVRTDELERLRTRLLSDWNF